MTTPLNRIETSLLMALTIALLAACLGPFVEQHANYHAFADQRAGWGLPHAMDVLSNLPFAIAGVWGLLTLHRTAGALDTHTQVAMHRPLSALFFAGLIITAVCSSIYHWQPDSAGLAIDRMGMVVAFAGLLGLAGADRVSARAGMSIALTVMALGPLAVVRWMNTGDLLPWAILQGGGMVLILVLALCKPGKGSWKINLGAVIAAYALAKGFELGDHALFELTQGLVSGHSLKHLLAAFAAWPVIAAMHNVSQTKRRKRSLAWA